MGNFHHIKQRWFFWKAVIMTLIWDSLVGYPHGTVYICKFSGVFNNIQQIDDNSLT